MRIAIAIHVTRERLLGTVAEDDVAYDQANLVALETKGGRELIAAIGDEAAGVANTRLVDGMGVATFDPLVTAGVVGYITLELWNALRPGWRGVLLLFDRVEVDLSIDQYDAVPERQKRLFVETLPSRPGLQWRIDGSVPVP